MKKVIKYLGFLLIISAFFRLIPITTALIYGETAEPFILTAAISLILGGILIFLGRNNKNKDETLTLTRGLILVATSFIILPTIGAISFLPVMGYNFINALFESISGFTTTGLTMFSTLTDLPKSLIMWRAETQWMGGIGIVMVFLFFLSHLSSHSHSSLTEVEEEAASGNTLYQIQGFKTKLEPGLKKSIRAIISIYLFYTLLGIILLMISGMPLFNAIGMTFTSISTGGFSVSESIYVNNFQMIVLTLLMLIGAISFFDHNQLFHGKIRKFIFSPEKNVHLLLLAGAIIMGLLLLPNLPVTIFTITSAFTTTGYGVVHIPSLPQLFIFLIIIGMIIGGSAGSTAGGMKVFRIAYLAKAGPWFIKKLSSPKHAIIPFKVWDKVIDISTLLNISIFFFTYLLLIILGTIILLIFGNSLFDAVFQVISAIGTAGLQTMDLAAQSAFSKITLMILMLLGRLEIFPLLVLAGSLIRKR